MVSPPCTEPDARLTSARGAPREMATTGPEAWLGRRAKASGSSPLTAGGHNSHKPPEPQRGAFFFPGTRPGPSREKTLRSGGAAGHPLAPAGDDVLELVADDVAEAVIDRAQQSERDEDPGLGIGIARGGDPAGLLRAADERGDVLVHLADLATQGPPDLGVVRSLRERLDPKIDEDDPGRSACLEVRLADR